jgi:hypothetical protein
VKTNWRRGLSRLLAPAALILGICGSVQTANAGAFLWISAPTWTYSSAAAASPAGFAYFWAFSIGSGTYSWAYAFSNNGAGSAAYAFAEAATGLGGVGAVNVAGIADPYAGVGIDIPLTDPSNPSGFPTLDPSSDPFSTPYTPSSSGISLTGSGEELNGVDELEAFLYTGGTSLSTLESELGDTGATQSGTTSAGDVTDISSLAADFGSSLLPLDALVLDPSSLSQLNFTENDSDVNTADVILVGEGNTSPEPGTLLLLGAGLASLGALRRRMAR